MSWLEGVLELINSLSAALSTSWNDGPVRPPKAGRSLTRVSSTSSSSDRSGTAPMWPTGWAGGDKSRTRWQGSSALWKAMTN